MLPEAGSQMTSTGRLFAEFPVAVAVRPVEATAQSLGGTIEGSYRSIPTRWLESRTPRTIRPPLGCAARRSQRGVFAPRLAIWVLAPQVLVPEFQILEYLMRYSGQVVTRTMLLENVWNYHFDPKTSVIDVQISRLRQKLDKGFDQPLLHTVRGAGYCLRAPE